MPHLSIDSSLNSILYRLFWLYGQNLFHFIIAKAPIGLELKLDMYAGGSPREHISFDWKEVRTYDPLFCLTVYSNFQDQVQETIATTMRITPVQKSLPPFF